MERYIKCPHCHKEINLEEELKLDNDVFSGEINKKAEEIRKQAELEYLNKVKEKEIEIINLKNELDNSRKNLENAVALESYKIKEEIEKEFLEKENIQKEENNKILLENEKLKNEYERKLKEKDSEIEYYRDYKTKLSTKMVGESLEQFCLNEFNKIRTIAYPNAYFEKDNEVIQGSKGDFVFRNFNQEGIEICSIMFEMKNEMDTTASKQKNEDFFGKLDKDRKNKNCEYAVLVSMLEADSDYYNQGIVEVYNFEKMFVVRPQNFMSIISLINNISLDTIETKKELALYQNKHIELLAFEDAFNNWKDDAGKTLKYYSNNVSELKKRMIAMRKTADDVIKVLDTMEKQLGTSTKKIESGSVKKFAKNSPTMLLELKKGSKKN